MQLQQHLQQTKAWNMWTLRSEPIIPNDLSQMRLFHSKPRLQLVCVCVKRSSFVVDDRPLQMNTALAVNTCLSWQLVDAAVVLKLTSVYGYMQCFCHLNHTQHGSSTSWAASSPYNSSALAKDQVCVFVWGF